MKNTRTFRTLARSLLGAALTSASAFAISPDDLSALRAKAETGDGIAQHNLGLVYANSQETISDLVEAYAWLSLAADNGATGRSLMIVTRQMTPEQIADGKRRFEEIREAIVAKKPIPPAAAVTPFAATQRPPSVSPVSASPVSASPISVPSVETEAREAELKKISAELAAAWKENDQLKAAVTKAEGAAVAATTASKADKDQLAAALEGANREIAGMKAAAANFEGERNALLQKITDAQQASDGEMRLKVVALENDITKTRADLAAAKTQQTEAAKQIAAGEKNAADLAAAQSRIRSLESDVATLSGEKASMAASLATAAAGTVAAARANSEVSDLKGQLASSQQALAVANADVASLKQELAGAKNGVVPVEQHRALQANLEGKAAEQQKLAQDELKKVQDAAAAENARLAAALAAATAASTEEVGALKAGAANFEGERNGLLKKIADSEQSLATATTENTGLKQQIERYQKETVPGRQYRELDVQFAAATKTSEEQKKAIEELQKALVTLETEKSGLAEKLATATEASTGEVAALKAGAANFEGERNGLIQKIAATEQALVQATTEAASAKEQLAAAQAASGDAVRASAELVRVNQELDTAKKVAAASSLAIADAKAEATDLKQQLAEAKTGVVPAQQHQELQAKLDAALKSQELQQGSQSELQKTVAALETERNGLAEKLAAAALVSENETAALKAASANFEGERNALLQKIADAEQALVRANADTTAAKEQLAAAAKSSEEPAQQVQQLQAKLDAAVRAQESLAQQQAVLQQANSALETEGARIARELVAARAASADAGRTSAAAEELQGRLKTSEDAATAARAERDAMAQRVAVLEQQAAAAPATMGEDPVELRKQLDDASAKLATTLRSFELRQEEIDRLQKSLVSTDGERAALAQRIHVAEKQAAEANAASASGLEASAQLASMREQLRNAQNQIGQLAAENIQLKNRPASEAATSAAPSLVLSAPRRPATTSSPTSTPVRASQVTESRIHTVVEGETLTRIARRYYGNSERWADIYDANRASLPNPAALKIGMKLRIP